MTLPPAIVGACSFELRQTFVPCRLERLRHQPVGRINQFIPALCEGALVLQSLEPLLPLAIQARLLLALTLVVRQRELNRPFINNAQHEVLDERIDPPGARNSAHRLAEAPMRVVAFVVSSAIRITHPHSSAALLAPDQSLQERYTLPRRALARG